MEVGRLHYTSHWHRWLKRQRYQSRNQTYIFFKFSVEIKNEKFISLLILGTLKYHTISNDYFENRLRGLEVCLADKQRRP